MDLRTFSDTKESSSNEHNQTKKPASEKEVKEKINQFSKLNNDQLMTELVKQIATQREQGKMENVLSTIERIKPFLNAEQKKKLEKIIEQLEIKGG